jgi:hypothetical protein
MVKFVLKMVISAVILLSLTACNLMDRINMSAVSAVDSGSVLFYDDFSSPDKGDWATLDENGARIAFEQEGLRFQIDTVNYDYWSLSGMRLADATVAVQATMLAGPEDNDFGLICRFRDENNYYALLISSDGYGGIVKVKDGLYTILNHPKGLEFGPMIHTGAETNLLRADCIDDRLTLYVNHEKFLEVRDADFTFGEVGLIAGSFSQPGVDILFDDFFVIKP